MDKPAQIGVPASRYWTEVYLLAASLLKQSPEMPGDVAFNIAKESIDKAPLELEPE